MINTMDMFNKGSYGTIRKVNGEGKVKRRLFDMGVTPGAIFYIKKLAPLKDPIEISIRGYDLSLRLSEAKLIECEVEERNND